jgi:hypothetical protein
MKLEIWVSIYAALLSSALAALQIRNYFHSGVRLKLSLIADGMTIGGGSDLDENDIVILSVTNRGDRPTVIQNMVLLEDGSWWQRFRKRPKRKFIIPNPELKGYPPNIPFDLKPSQSWTGVIRTRPDIIPNLYTGKFYAGICASHRNKPYLERIPKPKTSLQMSATKFGFA